MKAGILAITLLYAPALLLAQGSIYKTDDLIRVESLDTIKTQLVTTGKWIDIFGHIQNDFFAAGEQITLNGSIGDDAFMAANSITIQGSVQDMVMAAGESILVGGQVGGDLLLAGREIRITQDAILSGRVFLAGETIHIYAAEITGPARIAGNSIRLNNRFDSEVIIYSGDISFGSEYTAPATKIISRSPVYRDNLGVIPPNLEIKVRKPSVWPVIIFQAWFYLSLLVTGLILLALFYERTVELYSHAIDRFWKNTGIGILAFFAIPLIALLLIIPLVTLPIAGILAVSYGFALFFSYLLVALILGMQSILWIKDEPTKLSWFWAMALGLIVIAILTNLPFIGFLFSLLLLFFGLGSITSYFWMTFRNRSTSQHIKEEIP